MKRTLIILVIFFLPTLSSYSQSWNWLTPDGSGTADAGKHLAIDANHNSAVTGVFHGSIFSGNNTQISQGGEDVFIARYDSSGNLLWTRSGGGIFNDGSYSMGISYDLHGNIYVLCPVLGNVIFPPDTLHAAAAGNIALLKYDSNGNHIYSKLFGGNGTDYATDINIDDDGNVFASGAFSGTATFDTIHLSASGSHDIFLAKFDSSGNTIWARKAGGGSYDNGGGIAFDDNGNIYLTGYYTGTSVFDTIQVTGAGGDDCFIAKYNSAGNIIWVRTGTGIGIFDIGSRVGIDFQNNIYVVGQFSDTFTIGNHTLVSHGLRDVFVAKLDPQGNFFWAINYGGPGDDIANDLKGLVEGSHYVTGHFSGTADFGGHILTSAGGTDIFVYLSDLNGTIIWAKQTGGTGDDAGRGIDADNLIECFVTGSYSDNVSFDLLNASSIGSTDVFTGRIFDPSTGINSSQGNSQVILYPNPATEKIFFKNQKKSFQYKLTDVYGAIIMDGLISPGMELQLKNMSAGIYFIYTEEGIYRFRKL